MVANPIEQYGKDEPLTDSVLLRLQQDNDVVLAFAVANYAWVKSVSYRIIALNKQQWKGYTYAVNYTRHTSTGLVETPVQADSCEALWKLIREREAVRIKGDNGEDFCTGEKKADCNINDGATWQLWFIAKTKIAAPSYYEPEFFERCCPGDKDRQLFLDVAGKLKTIVGDIGAPQQ